MKHPNNPSRNAESCENNPAVSQRDYDQERWVLDYINGHLSRDDRAVFEQQLEVNDELQALLKQTHDWQKTLHAGQASITAPNPKFTDIEHKLTRKKGVWFMPVIPVAFACMLVFTFSGFFSPVNQEFDTLTQAPLRQEAMLQLILAPNVNSDAVIEQYNLNVIESFSNKRILNVALTSRVSQSKERIREDQRVMMIKELGKTP